MEMSKAIDEPSSEKITMIPKSAEVERCETMIPKSAEVEMKPTRVALIGRSRPRTRSQDPANLMRGQHSSFLDLFEKETYKYEENLDDPLYLNDDEYVSDYDDDAVIVPQGVDPVLYKKRRKRAVAFDKYLQKLKRKNCEIAAARKEERERALLANQEKGGSTGVHQVVAV